MILNKISVPCTLYLSGSIMYISNDRVMRTALVRPKQTAASSYSYHMVELCPSFGCHNIIMILYSVDMRSLQKGCADAVPYFMSFSDHLTRIQIDFLQANPALSFL